MRVLVPLAEGFEEIEALTIVDILRRADQEVVTASLKPGPVKGSHGVRVVPDAALEDIDPAGLDAVVLPGGYPGFVHLGEDARVLEIVREMNRSGRYVAAICGAPSVLVKAGVIQDRMATVHPAGRDEIAACARYQDDPVVVDGNLITSKAAGTAMEFALKLAELLAGREKMRQIKEDVLA